MTLTQLGAYYRYFRDLAGISRRLNKCDTNACNGFHSERAAKINETKTARLLKLAETIAGIMGFTIEHQPDPRGCSLHLINPKDTNERVAI